MAISQSLIKGVNFTRCRAGSFTQLITEKDKKDIQFLLEENVDFIPRVSFVKKT